MHLVLDAIGWRGNDRRHGVVHGNGEDDLQSVDVLRHRLGPLYEGRRRSRRRVGHLVLHVGDGPRVLIRLVRVCFDGTQR